MAKKVDKKQRLKGVSKAPAEPTQAPQLRSSDPQVLELWVKAGGMCEFHGCNEYLLRDRLTTNEAKLADVAHIVARSKDGPRGDDPMPLSQRNKINNLFLACLKHHRMIDNKRLVTKYPKDLLVQYKQTHEERIRFVTSLGDESETWVLRMLGNIRGNTVSVSNEEIREAVLKSSNRYPRYLGREQHVELDLRSLLERDSVRYWSDGTERIKDVIDRQLIPAIQKNEVRHLSVFAFARIPFLAYLGYVIGDKLPLDVYQKHRTGGEGWAWPSGQGPLRFIFRKERVGKDEASVVVMISLSGQLFADQLPSSITENFTVYAVSPEGVTPSRSLILSRESMDQFRQTYAALLRDIEATFPLVKTIHLFPAVPISAAVVLGRELLRNVSPSLLIYDVGANGFEQAVRLDSSKKD
jgi:hypothetical protein